jgi:hypothetical protein
MCTDEIADNFWKKFDKGSLISNYDIGQALTEAIIFVANKHKKLLLDTIKGE